MGTKTRDANKIFILPTRWTTILGSIPGSKLPLPNPDVLPQRPLYAFPNVLGTGSTSSSSLSSSTNNVLLT
jgi:hypothetical protein